MPKHHPLCLLHAHLARCVQSSICTRNCRLFGRFDADCFGCGRLDNLRTRMLDDQLAALLFSCGSLPVVALACSAPSILLASGLLRGGVREVFGQRVMLAVTRLRHRLLRCRNALKMRRACVTMALGRLHGICTTSSTIVSRVLAAARCSRAAGGLIHGEAATNPLRASRGVCAVNGSIDCSTCCCLWVELPRQWRCVRGLQVARQGAACSGQEGNDGASPSAPEVVGLASSSTTRSSQPSS